MHHPSDRIAHTTAYYTSCGALAGPMTWKSQLDVSNERKGNVLFNDAFNTFYLQLYGVRHLVKDHTDSERGNPLPPHGLLFPISSMGYFICTIPQTDLYIPQPLLHRSLSTGWNEK